MSQTVRFGFGECEPTLVTRSVVAAVDHLCAVGDIELALLDALEVPIAESLLALHANGIEAIVVKVDGDVLTVQIATRRPSRGESSAVFGAASDLIEPFFDVIWNDDHHVAELRGAIR